MIPKWPAPNRPVQLQTVGWGVMGLGWGYCCDELGWALLSGMAVLPQGTRCLYSPSCWVGVGSPAQHPSG